jgi:oligopeptide/dipeptide ABC transporter ATP-binding protein
MPEPALQVQDLTIAWGPAIAVYEATFTLAPGEALGLLGESGSGKSTLVRGLLRLLPPPARILNGAARLGALDLLRADEAALRGVRGRRVALVPQAAQSALNPVLTLRAHAEETLRAHSVTDRDRQNSLIKTSLTRTLLDPALLDRWPHQLSGGQRQRAAIALALLLDPAVLVLDEPTSALDVLVERELLALLQRLQQELGLAVLLVTHDLPVLRRLAHRVAVLHAGRIVEVCSIEAALTRPAHPYTQMLVRAAPPPLDAPVRLQPPLPEAPPAAHGCPFSSRCPQVHAACAATPRLRPLAPDHLVACHGAAP